MNRGSFVVKDTHTADFLEVMITSGQGISVTYRNATITLMHEDWERVLLFVRAVTEQWEAK